HFRPLIKNAKVLLNGEVTGAEAAELVASGQIDAAVFVRPFIANPGLIESGYTDYPVHWPGDDGPPNLPSIPALYQGRCYCKYHPDFSSYVPVWRAKESSEDRTTSQFPLLATSWDSLPTSFRHLSVSQPSVRSEAKTRPTQASLPCPPPSRLPRSKVHPAPSLWHALFPLLHPFTDVTDVTSPMSPIPDVGKHKTKYMGRRCWAQGSPFSLLPVVSCGQDAPIPTAHDDLLAWSWNPAMFGIRTSREPERLSGTPAEPTPSFANSNNGLLPGALPTANETMSTLEWHTVSPPAWSTINEDVLLSTVRVGREPLTATRVGFNPNAPSPSLRPDSSSHTSF
ncbi:hypothetical protein BDK51DRAFT_47217, partial [Blyttiomyces helicus]